ncbi:Protein bli-3 [Pseudocercospora fuligena]|uniref:Protein bli-3 n=1 Tax=Pseudocercospora fuligena TaxID=685502 RepID=A0A8H6RT97_9PEZI|nr:Protein bli-3 [Pseudocercospora fuligena]
MPEKVLTPSEDPSVTKQYDSKASAGEKFKDFYEIADNLKISMLGTYRQNVGPVSRSMAVAKRTGPDFLFLANANSQKFKDLEAAPQAQVIFQDSKTQDWIAVSGEATTTSNSDPRIKEIWSKGVSAWFGDVGDGVHDGGPEDPRMKLIEVKSKYITYWKHETGALGFMKEVGVASLTGRVAKTGSLREMHENEIQQARQRDSALTS